MRDKLHDYLLQRPAGARTEELAELVFRQTGANPGIAHRVVADLLAEDPRFARRDDGTWHATVHATLALPISEAVFTVVDLETTSIDTSRTGIIEIGAARVHAGRVVDEFQQLVNPGVRLPPFIVGLTGIDDHMLADAPEIGDVWPRFREFIADSTLVAHNAAFDVACLQRAATRLTGSGLDNHQLCTLKLARLLLPDLGKRGLDALAGHFGIPQADRHRALGDVRVTVEVFFRLLDILAERGVERLDQLLEFQNRARDGKPFVSLLPRDKVAGLPEAPGIYRLLDEKGSLLYVGKAKSLRERVSTYLSNAAAHSDKTLELIRAARDVRVERLGSELEAALAEAAAIRRDKPPYNRLGRHLPRVAFLKISLGDDFPRLSVAKKMAGRRRSRFIGPFRSSKDAERALDVLAREFQLRTCPGALRPDPEFEPCSQLARARCTAPCAARVSIEEYRQQVDTCLAHLREGAAGLEERLRIRVSQRANRGEFEGAAYSQREIDSLHALVRSQRRLGWLVDYRDWVAFERAVDRSLVLAYGVVAGKLVLRARLGDDAEIDAFADSVRGALGASTEAAGGDVDGTTILAAWMRDRVPHDGYVFPILDEALPEPELSEWRAACRDLLSRSHGES